MATSYFGNRSGSSGISPFYQLRNFPLVNKTNYEQISFTASENNGIPVLRAAAANNRFLFVDTTNLRLVTDNASGTSSTVSTVTVTTLFASSTIVTMHLNTTDQCMYVLLRNGANQLQLIKVTDAGGTSSALGSPFTPATPARWPSNYATDTATMYVDGAGHVRVYYRGYYHQINKTTGAIVSQDNAVTIGSYSLINTNYVSNDGTVACSRFEGANVAGQPDIILTNLISATSGVAKDLVLPQEYFFAARHTKSNSGAANILMVDSDKIFLGSIAITAQYTPMGYYYRSDFDQALRSVADWYAGS